MNALLTVKSNALFRDMRVFGIRWHQQRKCSCMESYYPNDISENTYVSCEHLKEAQNREFKERTDYIVEVFHMAEKKKPRLLFYCKNPLCFVHYLVNHKLKKKT